MNPDDLKRLFPNASTSTFKRNLSVSSAIPDAKQCERPKELARSDAGEAPRPGLHHCCFTLHRKKLLDVDAKYASVKDLLDCLTIAGVIRGDKEGEITLEVNQVKTKPGEAEATFIEVSE